MEPIKIDSCDKCSPDKWTPIGKSAGTYVCKCKEIIKQILRKEN